ncbi:hypothetical protein IEQ34_019221 [Dendrobium chrysotoxum]|uniref:Uncharacterized protein n=1 Tax=Dendrobium chrysotoxum TaxID=161865 RepID=A0AAV7G8S5_DENCH|nr:hypothetical protein IEQ34_019221 [Dendrobium chrysotoxum]
MITVGICHARASGVHRGDVVEEYPVREEEEGGWRFDEGEEQQEMKTGTMLLLLLLLLTMTVCGVATTRMAMMHGTSQELHIHLMKKVSLEDGTDENENITPSYPETSVDNHHKIPRTQFDSSGPSGADDGGSEGDDNKN